MKVANLNPRTRPAREDALHFEGPTLRKSKSVKMLQMSLMPERRKSAAGFSHHYETGYLYSQSIIH